MSQLVLVRHGESTANRDNVYTGWSDVPLTDAGRQEAWKIGKKLSEQRFQFTDCHTSVLQRAILTSYIVLDALGQNFLPIHKTWRLNERHYGALRGLNKDYTRKIFGADQVAHWRRGFSNVPPLLAKTDTDRRYQTLDPKDVPRGESLKMALLRLEPYYLDVLVPKLLDGQDQLVVAHGSSLRAMVKYIEGISDEGINQVEVQNGEAIVYTFGAHLKLEDVTRLHD